MLFTIISFLLFLPSLTSSSSEAQTWIKAGYWYSGSRFPAPDMDSTLFTHLTCAFAHINTSNYELSISPSDEQHISTFTDMVRQKNPSIITLLSILAGDSNSSTFLSMATQPSHRSSFIKSSIRTARVYGFHGLDLYGVKPDMSPNNMKDMGILFDDWKNRESKDSNRSPRVLTMAGHYLPSKNTTSYPMESIRKKLDWVHIISYDYHLSTAANFTGAHSALYDPSSNISNDLGIKEWISRGLPADKMVLGFIKSYMKCFVTNYCITGSVWISYDDAENIRTKVCYAREKGLLGKELQSLLASAGIANDPNLQVFSLTDLAEATNNFSFENMLGEGGYGPIYKMHCIEILQAYELWKCAKGMEFMNPSLDDTNSSCKLVRWRQIVLLCVQENPADIPSMLELSVMLNMKLPP
ncbi:hypothetical protein RHSIM_Rhsim01G0039800 [Rhododendron simsii]|uniref:GH18 domain-containing protein n=1 Tax=Rhododendron simsii TaxID=118357 RepID=A0A834LVC5_RHOSS|nr:hypothetical protein RHSIM_Rhsim01G0039800 [Rhododendron simsii]